jgi:phospholipid/cholesterol/gamma-HCH transport system substrate-binding protein
MKKEATKNKIKLGVFVTIGVLFFILAIYFVGQRQQLFSSTFYVSGTFKDIGGLQVGNNVRFSGINVGIVDDIEQVTDSTVRVGMEINNDSRKFIKRTARAIIGSDGLLGNKILLIIPGTTSNQMLSDNDTIATAQAVSMDDILVKIKTTSENAALITSDLAVVTNTIRQGKGTIGKLFMDTVMAQNVDDAMLNIKQGTGGFKQNMDAASHSILLRGYLKKKEKAKEKKKEEKEKEKE